jgi:hypothetical protein
VPKYRATSSTSKATASTSSLASGVASWRERVRRFKLWDCSLMLSKPDWIMYPRLSVTSFSSLPLLDKFCQKFCKCLLVVVGLAIHDVFIHLLNTFELEIVRLRL